ncbi:hypothetical protein AB1Y20_015673 [Prymnesium parvum]|uniref:Uncharacterized protein n=1 Tax=Prymnesium parvum TaxID=97485 RepID=A0AB34JZ51_PRYPA
MVNIRAMHKLEEHVKGKVLLGKLPVIDDFLDELVNKEIAGAQGGSGDDVEDAAELAEDTDDELVQVVRDLARRRRLLVCSTIDETMYLHEFVFGERI